MLMKTFITGAACLVMPAVCQADSFQIFDRSTPYHIAYAKVYVGGQLKGYTDMYGRIRLDLSPGKYTGEITYRDQRRRITFHADGAAQVKRIDAS